MEPQIIIGRMPNTLYSCIEQVREAYLDGRLEIPLTASNLRDIGMKTWHVFPTKRSLEDMNWFHNGEPTPIFQDIAQAHQSDHSQYESLLTAYVEDYYHEIFSKTAEAHIDLSSASATQIEKFFQDYEPKSEAKNMAYLFLTLCREAGLIPPLEKRSHASNGKYVSRGEQTVNIETPSESQEGPMNGTPRGNTPGLIRVQQEAKASRVERQRKYVLELLETLPKEGQDREWWVDALRTNVELLIKLFS